MTTSGGAAILASIPSPSQGVWDLGPFPVRGSVDRGATSHDVDALYDEMAGAGVLLTFAVSYLIALQIYYPVPGLEDLSKLVARARDTGLDADLLITGPRPDPISDATSLVVYRIVQESVTTARLHAAGAPSGFASLSPPPARSR